jgi:lipooligosaccharide transport system permease protein
VRHAVFGFAGAVDLVHLGVLLAFAMLTWRIAIRWMERRLVI